MAKEDRKTRLHVRSNWHAKQVVGIWVDMPLWLVPHIVGRRFGPSMCVPSRGLCLCGWSTKPNTQAVRYIETAQAARNLLLASKYGFHENPIGKW